MNAAPPALGSIEHLFLFLPLVAAPLALLLRDAEPDMRRQLARIAQRLQPLAAVLLLASFCLTAWSGSASGYVVRQGCK